MRAIISAFVIVCLVSTTSTVVAQVPLENLGAPPTGMIAYVDPPEGDAGQLPPADQLLAPTDQFLASADQTVNMGPDSSQPIGEYVSSCRGMYFQADGLYWGRVGTGCDQVLVINNTLTTGADTLYRTNDLNFNGTGGMRFLVGWTPDPCRCSRCCAFELSYFGLFGWQAHAQIAGPGNLAIPGDLGLASNNFFGADLMDVNYRSSLHNVELNCIKSCCLCDAKIDFLAGFRFITLQERFTLTATDFQEGTSNYNIKANNYLFGGQLGGRYTRYYDHWSLQFTGKAGVFLNQATQSQIATDFPTVGGPFLLRDRIGANNSGVAALGEVGVTAIRPINDTWSLRLGYMALGIGGVALAPDQLDFTDTFQSGNHLSTNGWIFVHGAVLGAEARW